MRTRLSILALVGASGLLSACGSVPGVGTADGHAIPVQPKAKYLGAVTTTSRLENAGVTLEPPGAARPAVSMAAAYDTCLSGDSICPPGLSPSVTLALATSPQAGHARPDGSIRPLMSRTLVYVLTFSGVPCAPVGGPPNGRITTPKAYTCTVIDFVDATSGKVLYSVESPKP